MIFMKQSHYCFCFKPAPLLHSLEQLLLMISSRENILKQVPEHGPYGCHALKHNEEPRHVNCYSPRACGSVAVWFNKVLLQWSDPAVRTM